MAPGKTPLDNLRFITFVVNTLMAVYKHNGLLKASISSATNAHRLGANEAPPAIISSFLGTQLSQVLGHIEESDDNDFSSLGGKHGMRLNIPQIPELLIDNTDRNRTSPFAFTGNRFEFRAVGSEANCASAMIALNAAVAHQLVEFKKDVDAMIAEGTRPTSGDIACAETLYQRMQGDTFRRERLQRRVESRGCPPWSRLRDECSSYIRQLSQRKFGTYVRGDRGHDP